MTGKDRLEILHGRLRNYLAAERAILQGQSYSLEGLSLTRANLGTVRQAITELEYQIAVTERKLSGHTRGRIRIVVPVDTLNMARRSALVKSRGSGV